MKHNIVPNPPEWVRRNKKYPIKGMLVGSLLVIEPEDQGCKDIKSFRALVWNRAKALGYELSCRERDDGAFEIYRSK